MAECHFCEEEAIHSVAFRSSEPEPDNPACKSRLHVLRFCESHTIVPALVTMLGKARL